MKYKLLILLITLVMLILVIVKITKRKIFKIIIPNQIQMKQIIFVTYNSDFHNEECTSYPFNDTEGEYNCSFPCMFYLHSTYAFKLGPVLKISACNRFHTYGLPQRPTLYKNMY